MKVKNLQVKNTVMIVYKVKVQKYFEGTVSSQQDTQI